MVVVTLGHFDSVLRDLHIPLAQGGLPRALILLRDRTGPVFSQCLPRPGAHQVVPDWGCSHRERTGYDRPSARGLWSFTGAYFFVGPPGSGYSRASACGSALTSGKRPPGHSTLSCCRVTGMTATLLVVGLLLGRGVHWRMIYLGEAVITLTIAVVISLLPSQISPGARTCGSDT